MKYFLKLNAVSAIYGLLSSLFFSFLVSYERIQVLTGLTTEFVWNVSIGAEITLLCGLLFIIPFVTRKWLESRLWSLFSSILWFPYFVLFTVLIGSLFSIINIDNDNFAAGLILFFYLFFFPIFLFVTTLIGTRIKQKTA
ncbi:hypothetical protein ACFCYN_20610 [Gottfriedia sp. NPDC056225]|uniref:hypothetical protein n=1 Tax=Gottfriedia sp. NPDC056225 TaxID=3345751 RepID=UPI0035E04339